jgi:hypothetical protein
VPRKGNKVAKILFACLIIYIFELVFLVETVFFLTTNQRTILSVMTFQRSEQAQNRFQSMGHSVLVDRKEREEGKEGRLGEEERQRFVSPLYMTRDETRLFSSSENKRKRGALSSRY